MAAALFIGNSRPPEFAGALAALSEAFEVTARQDIAAACEPATDVDDESSVGVELIVLAQSRPGEYAAAEVDCLRRRYPAAALVSLLGSWCEGEMRSGKPLAASYRLYWYQAAERLRRAFAQRAAGRAPLWSLPATSTEDERILCGVAAPIRRRREKLSSGGASSSRGTIAVCGHERTTVELIVDASRASGYDAIWIEPRHTIEPREVIAAIWDLTAWTTAAADELQWITRLVPAQRVVALLGFPRWHDIQRSAQQGLGAIVFKPLVLDDLYSAVDRIAERSEDGALR